MEGEGSTDRRAGSHNPLFYRRPPPVEAVFGGTEDARGAKGERTAAAVLTSIYAAGGSLIPFPFSYSTLTSVALPPSLPHFFIQSLSLFRSHYFPFSISLTEYLFIYAACSVAVAAATRSLLFARHLMDIFVFLSLSLSLQINNIVTA